MGVLFCGIQFALAAPITAWDRRLFCAMPPSTGASKRLSDPWDFNTLPASWRGIFNAPTQL
jgi:hypothetical protein